MSGVPRVCEDEPVRCAGRWQGNVPCIRCGHGDACAMSGIKMLHGPEASVASVGVKSFEEDSTLLAVAQELAVKLREAVLR